MAIATVKTTGLDGSKNTNPVYTTVANAGTKSSTNSSGNLTAGSYIPGGAPSYVRADGNGGGVDVRTNTGVSKVYSAITNPTTSKPSTTTSYSSGSSGGGSYSAPVDDGSSARLQALRDAIEQSRDARLNALLKSLNLNINTYENELGNLDRNYQGLIDQSEVERYKTRNYIREALANRGQMDSGYGRQEAMNSDIKYGNVVNGIKAQREADRNTIRNAIASLKANYENDKANVNDQYNNSLLQLM